MSAEFLNRMSLHSPDGRGPVVGRREALLTGVGLLVAAAVSATGAPAAAWAPPKYPPPGPTPAAAELPPKYPPPSLPPYDPVHGVAAGRPGATLCVDGAPAAPLGAP